jgi:hypothetical protein
MSIHVAHFMMISQYLDPQYFEKAWRNCMYVMTHTWKTTLLWKVIMWKVGYNSYPHVKYSQVKEGSVPTNAFSSSWMHDRRKTGQWVHNTVNPLQWWTPRNQESELESEIWQPLRLKCTSHEYEERKMTLSQVRSEWDQCPASSSPAQMSKP